MFEPLCYRNLLIVPCFICHCEVVPTVAIREVVSSISEAIPIRFLALLGMTLRVRLLRRSNDLLAMTSFKELLDFRYNCSRVELP